MLLRRDARGHIAGVNNGMQGARVCWCENGALAWCDGGQIEVLLIFGWVRLLRRAVRAAR